MEPLPKIALERLRASHVVEHPEADLLTAYAEQALTTVERSQVAEHLSRCTDCRQVVALATELKPPTDNVALATKSISGSRGWLLSWPVLRWGALAACLVVVSAAGLLLTQRSSHRAEKISVTTQPEKTAAEIDQRSSDQPSAIPPPSSAAELKKQAPFSEPDMVAQSKMPGPTRERKEFLILPEGRADKKNAGSLAFAPAIAGKVVAEKPSQAPPAVVSPRSSSNQVILDNSPTVREEQVANAGPAAPTDQKAMGQALDKDEQPERVPAMSETVEVTAEAPTPQTQSTAVMAKSARSKLKTENKAIAGGGATSNELAATAAITNGSRLMRDVNAAQWTLSGDGVPQRSFDSGKTWEKVQVDHHQRFRALSAQGMDVWVGGLAGVLYHSSDVGLHWTRIIPVAESSTLTADILTIDFRDPLHGKLTTANRESWITGDAGKTWQKE
jgi:hypothetical protein